MKLKIILLFLFITLATSVFWTDAASADTLVEGSGNLHCSNTTDNFCSCPSSGTGNDVCWEGEGYESYAYDSKAYYTVQAGFANSSISSGQTDYYLTGVVDAVTGVPILSTTDNFPGSEGSFIEWNKNVDPPTVQYSVELYPTIYAYGPGSNIESTVEFYYSQVYCDAGDFNDYGACVPVTGSINASLAVPGCTENCDITVSWDLRTRGFWLIGGVGGDVWGSKLYRDDSFWQYGAYTSPEPSVTAVHSGTETDAGKSSGTYTYCVYGKDAWSNEINVDCDSVTVPADQSPRLEAYIGTLGNQSVNISYNKSTGDYTSSNVTIANSGPSTTSLQTEVTPNVSWIDAAQMAVTLSGGNSVAKPIVITNAASNLSVGAHTGTINISAANADNSPQDITVNLNVTENTVSNPAGWVSLNSASAGASITCTAPCTPDVHWRTTVGDDGYVLRDGVNFSNCVPVQFNPPSCYTGDVKDGDLRDNAGLSAGSYEYALWAKVGDGQFVKVASVVANVSAAETYTLNTSIGSGSGSITAPGINCPGDCAETYSSADWRTIIATPASGQEFSGWSSGSGFVCSGQSSICSVFINANASAQALFSLIPPSFNYSLSNSGTTNVTKSGSTEFGTNTITKTLVSGTSEAVTLSVTGLPSGVSVQGISNQGCSPTCTSVVTLAVAPTTPVGDYTVTISGSSLGKQTQFTLRITGNPMTVSCTHNPASALVGQNVAWTASVSGGTAPFTYSWSGTNIPSSPAPSTNPFNIVYSTLGQKSAIVTVTDSDDVQATCPTATVQVNFNPNFEEF